MPSQDDPVQVYKELSDWYDRRGEPPMRDRFLVLAADAALRDGRAEEADKLRYRLLKLNPHHLLKPYASFTQAMQAPDIQTYLRDLRLNYPPEVALVLLNSLRNTNMTLDETTASARHNPHEDDEATVSLGDPTDQLKVFSDAQERDAPETQALPKELLEPSRRPPPPAVRSPASSQKVPRPQPPPPSKKKPAPTPPAEPLPAATWPYVSTNDADTPGGGWFAVVLFVLVFLTGLVLAGYLLARPFLS